MLDYKKGTDFSRAGLTGDQARESARTHGKNLLSRQKGKSFGRRFLGNLNDPVIRILLGALAVNLLLLIRGSDWVETVGIGVAVFLAAFISTLSEHSSERAFERLSEEGERVMCRVRRDGQIISVSLSEVVVGDCVLLSAGDMIPADGILLDGTPSYVFEQETALKNCGLAIPQCTELIHRMRETGIELNGECVTVDDCVSLIVNSLKNQK